MKLTVSHYAELLDEATSDAEGKALTVRIAKFLNIVRGNRAWSQLPRIISAYEARIFHKQGITRVIVKTPKSLSTSDEQSLADQLGLQAKSIVWDVHVDSTLIGGLQIHIGDHVVRGSVKDHIESLSKQLTN